MKTYKSFTLLIFLSACILHASAQETVPPPLNAPNYNKAKIFSDLPEKMPLRISNLERLLDLPVGTKVNAVIANDFPVVGSIISRSNPTDPSVKSVVMKVSNRQGSTFTFTRIMGADGTVSFIGRMLNKAGGDAFEIAREGQQYVIRKKAIYDIVNE